MSKNRVSFLAIPVALVLAAAFAACGGPAPDLDSDGGAATEAGASFCAPFPNSLTKWDSLPGLSIHILAVNGGTGENGNLKAGDTISVTFNVLSNYGSVNGACSVPLADLSGVGVWFAGPTSNYQHLLPISSPDNRANVEYDASGTVANPDGSYTFTFPDPIPATYGPPLWDTPKFSDGELTGQPLQDGTYTIAMRAFRTYEVEQQTVVDPSTDVKDVLVGAATTLEPREVVKITNCNTCHTTMQRHSGIIRDTRVCVTCHTAGAEDGNSTATGDATPQTTELGVMIHKIHSGRHLPSVLGITTKPDGTRDYTAPSVPYVIGSGLRDFSRNSFPVSPTFRIPMPRDQGYTALGAGSPAQQKDDQRRMGVTACEKCHGDPDGAGPLTAPAQGDKAYSNPKRRTCGSCHDDINWSYDFQMNGHLQPASQMADDTRCATCHPAASSDTSTSVWNVRPTGAACGGTNQECWPVKNYHVHPLEDPNLNKGLKFTLTSVAEANGNGDGIVEPGENVQIAFTVTDAANNPIDLGTTWSGGNISIAVSGPTWNRNLLLANTAIPHDYVAAADQTHTMIVPAPVSLDFVGTAGAPLQTSANPDAPTRPAPIVNAASTPPTFYARTGTSATSGTLSADAPTQQNFVLVGDNAGFSHNDYVVIDDCVAGAKEFQLVNLADIEPKSNRPRLWLSPGLRHAHAGGAVVQKVTLSKTTAVALANAASGTLTASGIDGQDVVATYLTTFVVPSKYPPPLNDSPDLDETSGKWRDKSIVPGTYTIGIWAGQSLTANPDPSFGNDSTPYKNQAASAPATKDFILLNPDPAMKVSYDPTVPAPYSLISSGDNCNGCHVDLQFHGSRRGFDTCILCHGSAGGEDRPQYLAANAHPTTGVTINYRGFVHELHMGTNLPNVANDELMSGGAAAYPNNFTVNTFESILFPVKPGGVKECTKCHGSKNTSWLEPMNRDHPTQQGSPTRTWRAVCGACHDGNHESAFDDGSHFDTFSPGGNEGCGVCHGPGKSYDVAISHKSW